MTPEQLFEQFRQTSDPEPLGKVFDLVADDLYRVALHVAGDRGAAEDLVQQTFLAAIEYSRRYDAAQSLRSWLLGILHNKARGLRRQRSARSSTPAVGIESEELPPIEVMLATETVEAVTEGLRALPQPYKEVLELRLLESVSNEEIADRLGRSPGAVRSQVWRGLQMLRKALPKSLALALGVQLLQQPGLAAVRVRVLSAAAGRSATATAATVVGGVSVVAMAGWCVAVVAAIAIWFATQEAAEPIVPADPTEQETSAQRPVEGTAGDALSAAGPDLLAARSRQPVAPVAEDAAKPRTPPVDTTRKAQVLVVDSDDEPVADARLEVFALHRYLDQKGKARMGDTRAPGKPRFVTTTDALGRCTIDLDAAPQLLSARKEGVGSTGDLLVRGKMTEPLRLMLQSPIRVTGVVVRADGSPAAGATVVVSRQNIPRPLRPAPPPPMIADAQGAFACELMPGFEGYRFRARLNQRYTGSASVDLSSGSHDRQLRLHFAGAFTVRGTLLGSDGEPTVGKVMLDPIPPIDGRQSLVRKCRADGEFEFLMSAGGPYHVVGGSEGASAAYERVDLDSARPHQLVRVQLGKLAAVVGKVIDHRGQPCAGVLVGMGQASRETALLRCISGLHGVLPRGETEADGSFRFMAPVGHRFRIGIRPVKGTDLYVQKLLVTPPARGLTIVLTKADQRGVLIKGVVVAAATGKPVRSFTVSRLTHSSATSASIGNGRKKVDPEGRFELGPLRPGKHYAVKIDAEGFAPHWTKPLDPQILEHTVRVELEKVGSVHCFVTKPGGKPLRAAGVWLEAATRRPFGRSHSGRTDASGSVRIKAVPPGKYRVFAHRQGVMNRHVSTEVIVVPGKETRVDLSSVPNK